MLFIWSELNIVREFSFGVKCRGLRLNGLRPDAVFFSDAEARKSYVKSPEDYLCRVVFPALRK